VSRDPSPYRVQDDVNTGGLLRNCNFFRYEIRPGAVDLFPIFINWYGSSLFISLVGLCGRIGYLPLPIAIPQGHFVMTGEGVMKLDIIC